MDLLDNLDAMFPTFIATPKTAAFASICLGIGIWMSTTSVASKTFDFEVDNRKHAPVISPTMPDDLTLFGELVPLQNFGVREALDRELVVNTYRHSSTILYLKRASRWFPLIEPILNEEGVPSDFKYPLSLKVMEPVSAPPAHRFLAVHEAHGTRIWVGGLCNGR